jgi:hypothetical protein
MAAPVPLPTPDPLVRLYADWRRANRRLHRIYSRQDEAEGAAHAAGFVISAGIMEVGTWGCCSAGEIPRAADAVGFSPERGLELVKEYRRREAYARRQRVAAGLDRHDAAVKVAGEEWYRVFRAVTDTPAASYEGLAVKLRFIKEYGEDEVNANGLQKDTHDRTGTIPPLHRSRGRA